MLASLQRESWACSSQEWGGSGLWAGPSLQVRIWPPPSAPSTGGLGQEGGRDGLSGERALRGYITLKYYQSVFVRLGVNNVKINQRLQMKFPPPHSRVLRITPRLCSGAGVILPV